MNQLTKVPNTVIFLHTSLSSMLKLRNSKQHTYRLELKGYYIFNQRLTCNFFAPILMKKKEERKKKTHQKKKKTQEKEKEQQYYTSITISSRH